MQAIPERIRTLVAQRANFRCEYCQIHSDDLFLSFEIDHILLSNMVVLTK